MIVSKNRWKRFMEDSSPPPWLEALFLVTMMVSSYLLYQAATRYQDATEKRARMERFIELEKAGQKSP